MCGVFLSITRKPGGLSGMRFIEFSTVSFHCTKNSLILLYTACVFSSNLDIILLTIGSCYQSSIEGSSKLILSGGNVFVFIYTRREGGSDCRVGEGQPKQCSLVCYLTVATCKAKCVLRCSFNSEACQICSPFCALIRIHLVGQVGVGMTHLAPCKWCWWCGCSPKESQWTVP